jgi:diguanylate cyclase (GGDEF)-like protein
MPTSKLDDPFDTSELPAVPEGPARAPQRDRRPAESDAPGPRTERGEGVVETAERVTEKTLVAAANTVVNRRATLTFLTGFNAGQVFALDKAEHTMGRGTDADVWADDSAVSRHHARVVRSGAGEYRLEDLGSTNGTFVGGTRVKSVELASGDRVQLGPNIAMRFAFLDDQEEELQRRLYESSTRDALTLVYNRKYFAERLLSEVAHARRHKAELSLLMLDLDEFKKTNDVHGHLAGDMVLRVVASRVSRLIRVEDVLARYGGEEFVILARSTSHTEAVHLAERTRAEVEQLRIAARAASLRVTTSIGVAALAELPEAAPPSELLSLADTRLYRAKMAGRNRVCATD